MSDLVLAILVGISSFGIGWRWAKDHTRIIADKHDQIKIGDRVFKVVVKQ